MERTIFDGGVKSQSIDAVKALLAWKGRSSNPLPVVVEFKSEEEEDSRLILVLSNKKDLYYTTTASACSCPASLYRGGPCKHQRKHFPASAPRKSAGELEAESDAIMASMKGPRRLARPPEDSIKPAGKWPGGLNGPVDEIQGAA
jgi:hypothetical protein